MSVKLRHLLDEAHKRKPQGRPLALGMLPEERWEHKRRVSRRATREAEAEEKAEAVAEALDPGPQLVCSHWARKPDQRHWSAASSHAELIVVDDCEEARAEAYWRERTPEGSRLTLTLWSGGYGLEGERYEVPLDGTGEQPPVAASMPDRLSVTLPDGSKRWAMRDGDEYRLRLQPGEEVVQVREVAPSVAPRNSATGPVARARARRAALLAATVT